MDITNKIFRYATVILAVLLLSGVVWGAIDRSSRERQLVQLRNELASQAHTNEIQKGVYEKLALETNDLRALLSSKEKEVKSLSDELKKRKEQLLSANQLVVMWKKSYEGALAASQSHVVNPTTGETRKRVTFEKDFGMIGVNGWTLTDPPEAYVKVNQLKPLQITLVLSQDKEQKWHTYATSSDENTAVDIRLASVNPHIMEPRWYEKLQLNTNLAVGPTGVLGGLGMSYQIKQFDLGPAVFLGISDRVDKYVGASFSWRPFQRVR